MLKPIKGIFYRDIDNDYLLFIMKEIWWDKLYNPFVKKDGVYLDLGANIGLWTLWAYKYASKVYSVEPSAEHFDTMTQMFTFNNMLDKVTPIKKALSNENTTATFYHSTNTTQYSLSDAIRNTEETETVECVDFEVLLKDIEHIDVCKMDVEGFESRVLASEAFAKVAPKIDTIVVEHHVWSGVTVPQLEAMLRDRGYRTRLLETQATVIAATK